MLRWFGKTAIALATLAGFALASTSLAAQPANQSSHRVALIDVAYIFKNLPAIKAQVSEVEGDLKTIEAELQQKRDALKRAAEQLKTLKPGTPDYARQEEHVAKLESKLRLDRVHKHRELSDAEARIYYDNYQRITAAVQAIATHNNIQLVLRFDRQKMDKEQSDSVVRGVMNNVVYHDDAIDMTDTVMQFLEAQTNTSHAATTGKASSAISR